MFEDRKFICDGCGKDITNILPRNSYTIQLRKKWVVFRILWSLKQSFLTGRFKRPILEDDFCYHADLCDECFKNVCKYAETKSKEVE